MSSNQRTPDQYRHLLKRYIEHVVSIEGVTYLEDRILQGRWRRKDDPRDLTDSELEQLRVLSEEVESEMARREMAQRE